MVAPAPGSTPMRNPRIEDRPITGAMVLTSLLSSFSVPMPPRAALAAFSDTSSFLRMVISASESANMAIASIRKLMPSARSTRPKVKR